MNKTTSGFTIVELLIVIVVIAILAAISIVAYNGIQARAYDSIVQSDLANVAKQVELYRVSSETNAYPQSYHTALAGVGIRISKDAYDVAGYNFYYCTNFGVYDKYAFAAKSKSGKTFYVSSSGNGVIVQNLGMNAQRACDRIEETPAAGSTANMSYAYSPLTGTWANWVQ